MAYQDHTLDYLKTQLKRAKIDFTRIQDTYDKAEEEMYEYKELAKAYRLQLLDLRAKSGRPTAADLAELHEAETRWQQAEEVFRDARTFFQDASRQLTVATGWVRRLSALLDQQEGTRRRSEWEEREKREREKARKERSSQDQPPKQSTSTSGHITPQAIQEWFAAWTLSFADKSQLRIFPEPPSEPCGNMSCRVEEGRALAACKCNIRKVFEGRVNLKAERQAFHPDRFASCPEDVRFKIQQKAKEVFVVVDAMYQDEQ